MNSILLRLAAFCIVVCALAPAALADRNRYSRDCDRDSRYVRYSPYDRYSSSSRYDRYDRCDPYYSSTRYDPYYRSSRYDRYDRCDDRVNGYITYRTGGRYDYRTRRTSPQFSISLRF